jgi:hypothetical protein
LRNEHKNNKRQQHLEKRVTFKEEKEDNMKSGTDKEKRAKRN